MNSKIHKLMSTRKPFLTDGGFETWLFFVEGFETKEFAANILLDDAAARTRMQAYLNRFLAIARDRQTGFVLDTNSWRGCVSWAEKLDLSRSDILRLTRDAVGFAKQAAQVWASQVDPVIINGVIGPAGDGYDAGSAPDAAEAERLHQPQMDVFAGEGVDMISALTLTHPHEAIGITRAAANRDLPTVISFTLETDGRLPSGESLSEAIAMTDAATDARPLYYMINCAHPDHFRAILDTDEPWLQRLGGIRANASRLSHAELDGCATLDAGNPDEFGDLHRQIAGLVPNLRVVGGCCGTDERHVDCVSRQLFKIRAASDIAPPEHIA